jgi:glycosyltransferase involved in cell wall biosynthesis
MPVKVLHIIKSLGRGGAEMLLPETLKLHNRQQFEFHYIYFLPWKDQMVNEIVTAGGKVTCLAASDNIKLMLKVGQVVHYVREHKIEIIHAHLPWAGVVARLAGRVAGVPVIYTEHNKQERYHFATRWMNLLTMNWLTSVVAVSQDVENSIKKFKPGLKSSLHVILNGVNIDHFAPGKFDAKTVKASLDIPQSSPVIGTIAVFRFQKRLDLWIEIASKILQQFPDTHFVIVGDGPLKEMLLEKQKQSGIAERIHFTGLQTEVRPYLAAFDLYMMTSIFEGLPIALLEAMASGCAVISTDAGGIKEVIREKNEGLLCSVDEPLRLVEFARLLAEEGKRKSIALAGRKRIEESFSMNAMVKALEQTYLDVVNAR